MNKNMKKNEEKARLRKIILGSKIASDQKREVHGLGET